MEYTKRVMRRYWFVLFFGLFGVVAVLIYTANQIKTNQNHVSETGAYISNSVLHEPIDITQYKSKIENALIMVPDTSTQISLVGGRASYGTDVDGGDVTLVKLLGGATIDPHTSHVFADIAVQSGGTGVFHYVALFEIVDGSIRHTSSHFIGDRVVVGSASVVSTDNRSYGIRINYLNRAPEQAMTDEPTIPQTLDLTVQNALFVESGL